MWNKVTCTFVAILCTTYMHATDVPSHIFHFADNSR